MQNERTLWFWEKYHHENNSKEWILRPTLEVLEMLKSHCPPVTPLRILEIGCGTSTLARDLREHVREDGRAVHVLATDSSERCVSVNRMRDQSVPGKLEYGVLNVLNEAESGPWDVVIDKGCLDTFAFRGRRRGGNAAYSDLLRRVLENVWRWMGEDGVYLLISPRARVRAVRDFQGFSSVTRHKVANAVNLVGKLDGTSCAYVYVCHKNNSYVVGGATPFGSEELPAKDAKCNKCGITFSQFQGGKAADGVGAASLSRQWKGHCIHCKT